MATEEYEPRYSDWDSRSSVCMLELQLHALIRQQIDNPIDFEMFVAFWNNAEMEAELEICMCL